MSAPAHRVAAILLIPFTMLALAGCGGNRVTVCPSASSENCCGPGVAACPVTRFLYAAGITGQVSSFEVLGAGALGSPVTTAGPTSTLGMAVSGNQFLYVSDFQNSDIYAWSNAMGGTLVPITGSPFSLGPLSIGAGLATTNTGFLYVADVGRVDAFQVGTGGALTPVPNSPFFSGTNLYLAVDPQDRFLFASDDAPPGGVYAFTIDSTTGGLTTVSGSPFAAVPNSMASVQPSEVVVDSTGNFVYTGLLGTGQVAGYAITSSTGALTPIPGSPFSSGNQPIALATTSNFLYVANAADHTLSGYTIDATTGVLTPITGSPFAIGVGALTINTLSNVLYASGAAGIYAFTIDSTTGALTAIAGSPFPSGGATVLTFVQ